MRRWDQTFVILESSAHEFGLAPESEGQELEIRQILFHIRKGRDYRALYAIQGNEVFVMHIRAPGQDFVSPEELRLP